MATATVTDRETATLVTYSMDGNIAIIELNDPPANTYTHEMMRAAGRGAFSRRASTDTVHVILLRGAGDKFFSAGANIKMLNEVNPTFKYYFCLHANETLNRLEQTPKLVIAALNGTLRGRRARDRDGVRHPHRQAERGQDRPPRGEPGRAPGHRRHAAAGAARRQGASPSSSW